MLKQKVHKHLAKQLTRHIKKHGHQKIGHFHHHLGHIFIHLGEMIIAGVVGIVFMLWVHANTTLLQWNSHIVYPLSDVAKLECRPWLRSEISSECITKLPIIHSANYQKYKDNKEYRFNYTVLWRGTYQNGRDIDKGAHPWVDIASVQWTPLYAIANGEVYFAWRQNGYGNVVKIRFRYWSYNYYAVYAHTNKIFVKKWQHVHRGQKIAEVGNTGMTFGAWGGYHVHFEINKEKNWRLEYYLTGCPDRSVGDFGIVDKGLCRKEIAEHQVDPIVFLESAGATLVKTENEKGEKVENIPISKEDTGDSNEHSESTSVHPSAEEQVKIPLIKGDEGSLKEKLEENTKSEEHAKEDKRGEPISEKVTKTPDPVVFIDENTSINTGNLVEWELPKDIDQKTKHFFSQYQVNIYSSLKDNSETSLQQWHKIIVTVVEKSTNTVFDGILPLAFQFITNNNKTKLSYSQWALVKDGKLIIELTPVMSGESATMISVNYQRLAVLRYTIL